MKIAQLRRNGAKIAKDVSIHNKAEILAKGIRIVDVVNVCPNAKNLARELVNSSNARIGTDFTLRCPKVVIWDNPRLRDNNDSQADSLLSTGSTTQTDSQANVRGRLDKRAQACAMLHRHAQSVFKYAENFGVVRCIFRDVLDNNP